MHRSASKCRLTSCRCDFARPSAPRLLSALHPLHDRPGRSRRRGTPQSTFATRGGLDWLRRSTSMGDSGNKLSSSTYRGFHQRKSTTWIFAHLHKRICDAFPKDWDQGLYNDAEWMPVSTICPLRFYRAQLGQAEDIREVSRAWATACAHGQRQPAGNRRLAAPRGSAKPRSTVPRRRQRRRHDPFRGGGTSPGMPRQNILAMLESPAGVQLRAAWPRRGPGMVDYAFMNQCLRRQGQRNRTDDSAGRWRRPRRAGDPERRPHPGMSVVGEDFKHNVLYVPRVLIAAPRHEASADKSPCSYRPESHHAHGAIWTCDGFGGAVLRADTASTRIGLHGGGRMRTSGTYNTLC